MGFLTSTFALSLCFISAKALSAKEASLDEILSQVPGVSTQLYAPVIHQNGESDFFETLRLVKEAKPGSTVDMAYFIFEDDFSTSYLVKAMRERATQDGVQFRLLVDYIMSEAKPDFYSYLASILGVRVKRHLRPSPAFIRYLKEDLQLNNPHLLIHGLCLQNADIILKELKTSKVLAPFFPLFEQVLPGGVTPDEMNLVMATLMSAEAIKLVPALRPLEKHFENFSRRMHHKLILARTSRGLELSHGGRNRSDEYHVSLSTPFGQSLLEKRNYPFFDLSISGVVAAEEESHISETFNQMWNAGTYYSELVRVPDKFNSRVQGDMIDEKSLIFERGIAELRAQSLLGYRSLNDQSFRIKYFENKNKQSKFISEAWARIFSEVAKNKITIISAYFFLYPELFDPLLDAMKRGVEVDVYTNSLLTTDMNIVNIASYQAFEEWMLKVPKEKLKLFELDTRGKKGSLHAKIFFVDDIYMGVGSANSDPRSHHLDTNNFSFIRLDSLAKKELAETVKSEFVRGLYWNLVDLNYVQNMLSFVQQKNPRLLPLTRCEWLLKQL